MSPRPKIVHGVAFNCYRERTDSDEWQTEDGRCGIWRNRQSIGASVDGITLIRRDSKTNQLAPRTFKTIENAMRAAVKWAYPRKPLTVAGFALVTREGIDVNTVCASREQAAGHLRVRYAGKGARIHPVTVIVERT